MQPPNTLHRREIAFEELDNANDDEDIELDESENSLSYSYAMPDKKSTYANAYNPSSQTATVPSNYYYSSQQDQKSYQQPPPTPQSNYAPTKSNYYKNKQTVSKPKTKSDYVESSSESTVNYNGNNNTPIYNTKPTATQSSYGQSSKSSSYSKNYQLEQQPLYHPVYEKLSVQPKSSKKYSTNQNSYQTTSYPHLSNGQYTKSNTVNYNSQPKLNYTMKSDQQQSAYYYTKPNNNYQANNYQTSYPSAAANYKKDSYSQTKPNYASYQQQQKYSNNNNMQYYQSIDNYKPLYELPKDLDYEFKQYDDANLYDNKTTYKNIAKPIYPFTTNYQSNNYQVPKIKQQSYQKAQNYPTPAPKNYTTTTKPVNYQPVQKQNYTKPMVYQNLKPTATTHNVPQNYKDTTKTSLFVDYNKPVVNNNYKPVEYKPNTNYQSNAYQAASPQLVYTEKPPVNTYNYPQYYKLTETPKYNQPTQLTYAKPQSSKDDYKQTTVSSNKNYYTQPTAPAPKKSNYYKAPTNYYQNYKPFNLTTKPNYVSNPNNNMNNKYRSNNYSTSYTALPPPKYQPINLAPEIKYEFYQYELANQYANQPAPAKPSTNYPPPLPTNNKYNQQSYQQYPSGSFYENELGNRSPYNNKVYATDSDYKMTKFRKEQKELVWRLEYDLNSAYSIVRSTPLDWINFLNQLRTDNALFDKYYRNLHRQSSAARWKVECNDACKQHLLDEIVVIDPLDY